MSRSECPVAVPWAADTRKDPPAGPGRPLLSRAREIAELRALAQGTSGAAGGALVLRGETGTGKTALLAEFARFAGDRRVVWLAGIAAEANMAWAALHRLLMSFPVELDRLPGAQRAVADMTAGIRAGETPDGASVEGAVLAVLADAARD